MKIRRQRGSLLLLALLAALGGVTPAIAAQLSAPPVNLVEAIVDEVLRLFLNL